MSQDQPENEPVVPTGDDVGEELLDELESESESDEVEVEVEVEGFMFIDLKPPTLGGPPRGPSGPSLPPSGPAGPGPTGPDTIAKPPRPGGTPNPFFPA